MHTSTSLAPRRPRSLASHAARLLAAALALSFVVGCGSAGDDAATSKATDAGSSARRSSDGFCAVAESIQQSDDLGYALGFTPAGGAATFAEVEAGGDALRALLDEMVVTAPEYLRDDVGVIALAIDDYLDAVEDAGFDVTAVDPTDPRVARYAAANAQIDTDPELDAANGRVNVHLEEQCGLTIPT